MTFCIHEIPGRIRIKTPFLKGNHGRAAPSQELVKTFPGAKTVPINPITGSLVVHYDIEAARPEKITEVLKDAVFSILPRASATRSTSKT
jgi:hypothetical protein